MSRKETERTKLIQEKCQTLLTQMLRDEDNKYCVDCDAKGPRWASWNLGIFLCIRCAGIHRNLGVHISRVKSVNLDTWTPEQVISLQQMGNSRARAVYEAQLPDGFRRPQTDTALESFIRAKYEHKKYLAREWVPPPPPKVDWAKEIDDELERQKRKKKAAAASSTLGLSVGGGSGIGGSIEKKSSASAAAKSAPLPAPLPKPKPGQCGSSPKTQRIITVATAGGDAAPSNDLLGLSSPTKPLQPVAAGTEHSDSFSGFLSAAPAIVTTNGQGAAVQNNNLAQEEEDFFNQSSIGAMSDKDKSGKLTKDSILALYGAAPPNPAASANIATVHNPHNPPLNYGHPQPPMFGGNGAFAGIAPGYMPHPHQQQQHQQQFMTPPNSASMNVYNAPVMTAPTAFGGSGLGVHATFAAQFPIQGVGAGAAGPTGGFPQQMSSMVGGAGGGGGGAGLMAGQPASNLNLMHTNQSLLSGMSMNMPPLGMGMAMGQTQMGGMPSMSAAPPNNANATGNLNQQFGNLNLGNVWQ